MENKGQILLLESLLGQTRLAVMEDGELRELYVDRPDTENLTGNIYLGRVENVLPGMSAAFVDIGIGKNAFLPASQTGAARIGDVARPGRELLVQVTKAATGDKGPRVSTSASLPGRTLALLPMETGVAVSKKITDADERTRLKAILEGLSAKHGMGAIARTAAQGSPAEEIEAEYASLAALWRDIEARARHAVAPKRLYSDTGLALRAVRDMLNDGVEAIITDNPGAFGTLRSCAETFAPLWRDRIRLHQGETPLFDLYRVDEQLDRALRKRVWLKSGGFLVIEETEALTVIDVNTGKFTGRQDLEDTVFQLNCEAAEEILRQLRLRDIGGIVVVDFIDMASPHRREALLDRMRRLAVQDRNRTTAVDITGLGLMELTRKRARQPLSRQLFHDCVSCGGSGLEPSYETTARRILQEVWRMRRGGAEGPLLVEASEPVSSWLRGIGAPAGGDVFSVVQPDCAPSEYRISPADPGRLPQGAQPLKRG